MSPHHHRPHRRKPYRALRLLFRDTRGRFTRLPDVTPAPRPRATRRPRRTPRPVLQLALFQAADLGWTAHDQHPR
jgi:hypothetical protein